MKVITRFPPSPTGYFHIGSARTALFNYLFTAHEGGTMYLRFEDTDKARSKKEYEDDILAGLAWLNIPYTLPPVYRQSERTALYKTALSALIQKGAAYVSEEPGKQDPNSLVSVVRLKNPGRSITFNDIIRGDVTFDTKELGDFVIARGIEDPLYHFTVVVDDADMGVTHVIRGEDHISNTPRQILILEALGYTRPAYAHIPLILAPDRTKLSKRHGATSVNEYRAQGLLPEAFVNYLSLLGWTPKEGKEKMSLEEIVKEFDLKDVHKGGAVFDTKKLEWLNREYMHDIPDAVFLEEVLRRAPSWDKEKTAKLLPLLRERVSAWSNVPSTAEELDFFFKDPRIDASRLPGKDGSKESAREHLSHVHTLLKNISPSDFANMETVKSAVWEYASEKGKGAVLWPLRYALSGKDRSPDPFMIAALLGKESTLERIETAINVLK